MLIFKRTYLLWYGYSQERRHEVFDWGGGGTDSDTKAHLALNPKFQFLFGFGHLNFERIEKRKIYFMKENRH